MKFYRNLQPFKVMSFDLDDTLYDNTPVLAKAEQQFLQKVIELSQLPALSREEWRSWKVKVAERDPVLAEDVVRWREESLSQLLAFYGKTGEETSEIVSQSMLHFLNYRHQIDLPVQTVEVLNQLKQHYPLIVITNGNVDPKRIGLDQFDLLLVGGKHGRAKPSAALFQQAAQHFNIEMNEILHIGDNLITDVKGAELAGCQSVWINLTEQNLFQSEDAKVMPCVEINDLKELLKLI